MRAYDVFLVCIIIIVGIGGFVIFRLRFRRKVSPPGLKELGARGTGFPAMRAVFFKMGLRLPMFT